MHALGRYVDELMEARRMTRPELVRASGLSRQHVHQLMQAAKSTLGRMPDASTIAALARAFPEATEAAFITKAAEAMGVPVDRMTITSPDFEQLSNDALLGILGKRLRERISNGLAANSQKSHEADHVGHVGDEAKGLGDTAGPTPAPPVHPRSAPTRPKR